MAQTSTPPAPRTEPVRDTPAAAPRAPRPVVSAADRERLAELREKQPNPDVLPADVRTEAEEHEFRELSKRVADADRQAALEASRPDLRPSPKERLAALKAKGQGAGEGEVIEARRIEDLLHDEARAEELRKMDKRTEEEQVELEMVQARAAEARAAGGFDPNG